MVSGDRYGHVDRVNGLITIRHVEGNRLEVRVRICELTGGQAHRCGTGIGAGSRGPAAEGEVILHIIERIIHSGGIAAYAVFRTIVVRGIVGTDDGYRHVNRVNRLITIRHVEGNRLEVRVRIYELTGCQAHIRCACIGAGSFRCAAEGEVILNIIKRIIRSGGVAAHGVFFTIIIRGITGANDGHRHIDRGNDLITVIYNKTDIDEVVICVLKVIGCQTHVCGSSVCAGCFRSSDKAEISFLIQLAADFNIIALDTVFRTIIRLCIIVSGDGHSHRDRINGLITILHDKGDIREVRVIIPELTACQAHLRCTGIRTGRGGSTAEGKVSNCIERITDFHIIISSGMFRTIVIGRVMVTRDSHNNRVDRGDRLISIHHIEGNSLKVPIVIAELFRSKAHVGSTDMCACGFRGFTKEAEVISAIKRVADFDIVAADLMLFTVISSCIVMSGDRYRRVDLVDGLIPICYIEGHGTEVRICICKLFRCQTHIRSTGIRTCRCISTAEGEVFCDVIQRGIHSGSITVHSVCLTVIVGCVRCTNDSYSHIDRSDGLITVSHIKRHGREVAILICELGSCQSHIGGSGICAGCGISAAESEVLRDIIQGSIRSGCITGHSVFSAIVGISMIITDDRYDRGDRGDRLETIRHIEGDCLKVRVHVCELFRCQSHVCGTGVCADCRISAAEGEVLRDIIQGSIRCGCITGHSVFSAIVGISMLVTDNGNDRSDRGDRLIAVGHLEGNLLEVFINIAELGSVKPHISRTGICTRGFCSAAEFKIGFLI